MHIDFAGKTNFKKTDWHVPKNKAFMYKIDTNHMLSRISYTWNLENSIIQYVKHIQAKRSTKVLEILTIHHVKLFNKPPKWL